MAISRAVDYLEKRDRAEMNPLDLSYDLLEGIKMVFSRFVFRRRSVEERGVTSEFANFADRPSPENLSQELT